MENNQPLLPNKVYHLFTHAVDNTNLFFQQRNYHYMLRKWQEHSKGKFNTYAYCFMPNHIHLCVQTLDFKTPKESTSQITPHSKVINNFLSGYAQAINRQENRKGCLFRSRFGRLLVDTNDYFRDLICYIHHNPIHHFGMSQYDTWQHTSYHDYSNFIDRNQESFLKMDLTLKKFELVNGFDGQHQHYKAKKQYISYEERIRELFTQL